MFQAPVKSKNFQNFQNWRISLLLREKYQSQYSYIAHSIFRLRLEIHTIYESFYYAEQWFSKFEK